LLNTCFDIVKRRKRETLFSTQPGDIDSDGAAALRSLEALSAQTFALAQMGQVASHRYDHKPKVELSAGASEQNDDRIDVQTALAQLGESDRLILTLFYLSDYSIRQIAFVMSAKEGAIRARLSRARERFRKVYSGKNEIDSSNNNDAGKNEHIDAMSTGETEKNASPRHLRKGVMATAGLMRQAR
jgi:RNA polymerase sigma-70 factor (ECF subfamily)